MKSKLVQIEVELLLLKYGENAVIRALALASGLNEEKLQEKIFSLQELKTKPARTQKEKKQLVDIANEVLKGAAHEEELRKLAALYQNKRFLPQLKDVKRFLGKFSIGKYAKSRNEATKMVFESLKKCSLDELTAFISEVDNGEQSSFATLADHIMGSHGRKSSND